MRRPSLGSVNLALVALYFVPVWGHDAVRALKSPFGGFEDRAQAAAAGAIRQFFDFGLDGLLRTSNVLAATKLVITAGFVAYLIEFARALVIGREPDRGTTEIVLVIATITVVLWAVPAFALDDAALVRLYATQLLLVFGAVIVLTVERHIEERAGTAVVQTAAPAPRVVATSAVAAIPAVTSAYKARLSAWRATRKTAA
jgi:hypothetical protein